LSDGCAVFSKSVKFFSAPLLFLLVLAGSVLGQSSRPGCGSIPYHDALGTGVTFRVWAPNATSVYVPGEFNGWSTSATKLGKDLTNGVWNGYWSADVTSATNGQQYKYYLTYSGGSVWKHDPRARKEVSSSTGAGGNDIIYDPTAFNWTNDAPVAPALNDLVIYELHIGTFYNPNSGSGLQGKFTDATNKLDYLKSLGVSAVEVLPIAEFPGTASWGYNPADIFAADNNSYGGPDGFKTFVKACHARGLAVLLDVIHNHYGPTDLDLWNFDGWTGGGAGGGIYFYQDSTLSSTPYGSRPNFSRQPVRDFIQQNFQMWLDECHVDGFRWDTPGLMMNAGSTFIPDAATLITTINNFIHTNYAGKISISEDVYNYAGFDSAWDTSYPYAVTPILTNTVDASRNLNTLASALAYNVRYGGNAGYGRVAFLESHDVVGDLNSGTRLVTAIDPGTPNSWRARKLSLLGAALTFTAPGVPMIFQGQEMLENQQFSSGRPVDWTKTNTYAAIVNGYRDLTGLRRNFDGGVAGLKGDQISFLQIDNTKKLLAYRRWQTNSPTQDVVVIANLTGTAQTNYSVAFPRAGNWYLHFNTDATNYSADFSNLGSSTVTASGASPAAGVTLGAYSLQVFSQTPTTPTLVVGRASQSLTLAWPVAYSNWVVETTTSLGGAAWTPIPAAQYQTNASNILLNLSQTGGNGFYRLRKS
jgi:1,4-alpha-glucan branching enzyme